MTSYSNDDKVSLVVFESALMHLQKANKRLTIITIIALVIIGITFGALLYLFTGFEIATEQVSVDAHDGIANYIGNDGDITNGGD